MARIDDAASSKCSLHGPSFLLPKAAAELEPGPWISRVREPPYAMAFQVARGVRTVDALLSLR